MPLLVVQRYGSATVSVLDHIGAQRGLISICSSSCSAHRPSCSSSLTSITSRPCTLERNACFRHAFPCRPGHYGRRTTLCCGNGPQGIQGPKRSRSRSCRTVSSAYSVIRAVDDTSLEYSIFDLHVRGHALFLFAKSHGGRGF